jgi:XTP/dITP diphosphohydrolase
MKIILATSNKGKVKEIQNSFKNYEIIPFSEVIEPFEIIEDGKTFQENAIIKAKAIYDKLTLHHSPFTTYHLKR